MKVGLLSKLFLNSVNLVSFTQTFSGRMFTNEIELLRILPNIKNFFLGIENFRKKHPGVYFKIREVCMKQAGKVFLWGSTPDFSFYTVSLGSNLNKLLRLIEGCSLFSQFLKKDNSLFLYEEDFLPFVFSYLHKLNVKTYKLAFNLTSILQKKLQYSSGDVSILASVIGPFFYYNTGWDGLTNCLVSSKKNLSLYQGFIGDIGVQYSNVILPTSFYYEKTLSNVNFYLNIDNIVKPMDLVLLAPSNVKSNEDIFIALFNSLELFFNNDKANYQFLFCALNSYKLYFFPKLDIFFKTIYFNFLTISLFRNSIVMNSAILQKVRDMSFNTLWKY